MLHDPARHEPLRTSAWDEARARALIERIVLDIEARFSPPIHPQDVNGGETRAIRLSLPA